MFATLPLLLLAVAVILVAAMPWRRTHPNHLFFLELLKNHLQEEPELIVTLPNRRNLGTGPRLREAADRQQHKRTLAVWGHSCVVDTAQGRTDFGQMWLYCTIRPE